MHNSNIVYIFAKLKIKKQMISIQTYLISMIIALVIGAVVGIFVYRNNVKTIGKVADKADAIKDVIKG